MSITANELDRWADRLYTAQKTSTPVPPPSELLDLDVADAYAIQQRTLALQTADGARLIGHKIGLTSAPMQRLLGVDEPDFGFVLDSMVAPDGGTIRASSLCAPRVEPEIAFRLNRPLRGPHVTIEEVLDATDSVAAALEIVDSRIEDWRITLVDTIADNASSGAIVLGPWVPLHEVPDLAEVQSHLIINDVLVERGDGSAVLGHPAAAVAWLANALAPFGGGVEAGQLVMSGSMTAAVHLHPDDLAVADLPGLGRVSVSLR